MKYFFVVCLVICSLFNISYAEPLESLIGAPQVVAIPEDNNPVPDSSMSASYTVFNYAVSATDFNNFLTANNLSLDKQLIDVKHVIYSTTLTDSQQDILLRQLSLLFFPAASGSSTGLGFNVIANDTDTQTRSEIIASYTDNFDKTAAKLSFDYASLIDKQYQTIKLDTTLNDVLSKNYVVVTQASVGNTLFGQIVVVSFKDAAD